MSKKKKTYTPPTPTAVAPRRYRDREQAMDVTRLVASFIKFAAKGSYTHISRETLQHAVDAYANLTDATVTRDGRDHYDSDCWLLDGEE